MALLFIPQSKTNSIFFQMRNFLPIELSTCEMKIGALFTNQWAFVQYKILFMFFRLRLWKDNCKLPFFCTFIASFPWEIFIVNIHTLQFQCSSNYPFENFAFCIRSKLYIVPKHLLLIYGFICKDKSGGQQQECDYFHYLPHTIATQERIYRQKSFDQKS